MKNKDVLCFKLTVRCRRLKIFNKPKAILITGDEKSLNDFWFMLDALNSEQKNKVKK